MNQLVFLFGNQSSVSDWVVLVPVLVTLAIDVALINYCLNDLSRRVLLIGGDKRFWTVVIILGGPLGQIAYWLYGRGEY